MKSGQRHRLEIHVHTDEKKTQRALIRGLGVKLCGGHNDKYPKWQVFSVHVYASHEL